MLSNPGLGNPTNTWTFQGNGQLDGSDVLLKQTSACSQLENVKTPWNTRWSSRSPGIVIIKSFMLVKSIARISPANCSWSKVPPARLDDRFSSREHVAPKSVSMLPRRFQDAGFAFLRKGCRPWAPSLAGAAPRSRAKRARVYPDAFDSYVGLCLEEGLLP